MTDYEFRKRALALLKKLETEDGPIVCPDGRCIWRVTGAILEGWASTCPG